MGGRPGGAEVGLGASERELKGLPARIGVPLFHGSEIGRRPRALRLGLLVLDVLAFKSSSHLRHPIYG